MSTAAIIFTVLLIIASLVLIASILLQSGKSAGLSGSIAGGAESIWGKKQGRSYEAILSKLTTVSAVIFILAALALTAVQ
ncbi:preprotein translocase subunit SecG [Senegalia massiliensis]|jgi:preprotein translocase subunit SecG|uniref:Protein-export membrane protein SecG n=1 Tax=Senegalia massiliensis TaxID=1720316 RepID=A0A845QRE6_9CLOT|nr:preprotein translocase subunit SecG [Senegalia massiliensis]NBI05357.1 preprotein translocase subunit SecG [Senegalia massiliensis]